MPTQAIIGLLSWKDKADVAQEVCNDGNTGLSPAKLRRIEMALYWVSYDLDKPGQDYTDLINRLRQWNASRILLPDWLLPHNNTTPEAIRKDLEQYLDDNDRIMVSEVRKNAAWRNLLISDANVLSLFNHAT